MPPQPTSKPPMSSVSYAAIGELWSQLQETQDALTNYTDKLHTPDSPTTEHDGFKHDIDLIKVSTEERK